MFIVRYIADGRVVKYLIIFYSPKVSMELRKALPIFGLRFICLIQIFKFKKLPPGPKY